MIVTIPHGSSFYEVTVEAGEPVKVRFLHHSKGNRVKWVKGRELPRPLRSYVAEALQRLETA